MQRHLAIAMAEIHRTFMPESVAMFERVMRGESVESIAAEYKTPLQAVHKMKQRIRDRMKALVERQIADEE